MNKSAQAWVVRARPHHHPSRIAEFLKGNLVALGWPGVGSLEGKDLDEIRSLLQRVYRIRDNRELGRSAGALDAFVNRVNVGDRVIVPSPEDGSVFIGEFRGGYRYVASKDQGREEYPYPHQRPVTWLLRKARIARDELPTRTRSSLRARQPIISTDALALEQLLKAKRAGHSGNEHTSSYLDDVNVDTDTDAAAREGAKEYRLRPEFKRIQKLREAKTRGALRLNNGRLICEVPGCHFDFEAVYGKLGRHYAHVHHRKQLGGRGGERVTQPSDLSIVCANCHAMIHRFGECREPDELIRRA